MNDILYYIRDHLVGTHYFIYAFIIYFLMFSIIGYLFKEKYAKYDIKLASSQDKAKKENQKNNNVTVNNTNVTNSNIQSQTTVNSQKNTSVNQSVTPGLTKSVGLPNVNTSTSKEQVVVKPVAEVQQTPVTQTTNTMNSQPVPGVPIKEMTTQPPTNVTATIPEIK